MSPDEYRVFTRDPLNRRLNRDLLDSFVRQIALVLDRQRLRDTEQTAKLVTESERLSKTLLNSVSHEIRTPIAAIGNAVPLFRAPTVDAAIAAKVNCRVPTSADALPALFP